MPIGLDGELIMMQRVRGVIAASISSMRMRNPSDARARTRTGTPPRNET